MKKVIYISAIVLGLGFVSCQKQEIAPASQEMEAPIWQDGAREGDGSTGSPIDTSNGTEDGSIMDDTEITDPNLDPDAG
ncbi:MAG: hypothetical protein Crog4KO_08880 [Crocinitomicaceae bacterium]